MVGGAAGWGAVGIISPRTPAFAHRMRIKHAQGSKEACGVCVCVCARSPAWIVVAYRLWNSHTRRPLPPLASACTMKRPRPNASARCCTNGMGSSAAYEVRPAEKKRRAPLNFSYLQFKGWGSLLRVRVSVKGQGAKRLFTK
jgi:hypothetical protein